jgi:endonuclease/exonuclease/phosphatase family metal-dependent hydrolase
LVDHALDRLTIATYNIHRGIGTDGSVSQEKIVKVLHEIDADIVALQELEANRDPALNMLNYLSDQTGLVPVAGPILMMQDTLYGNALLSRLPKFMVKRLDLSIPGHEPRDALDLDIDWNGNKLHLVATHLGLRPGERRQQVKRLLQLFRTDKTDLAVLMGDINEWFLWGRPLRRLHRKFSATPSLRTFPSCWPLFALDRIWVRPHENLIDIRVHESEIARTASDHLPLKAVIEMKSK